MTDEINVTAIREALEQAEGRLGLGAGQVEGVRRLIKELRAGLDKLEQEPKPWPQVGDEYWCVFEWKKDGVFQATYTNAPADYFRIATGNCQRTKAEALAYREWQTDPRVVARGIIERMDGFDPRGEHVIFVVNNTLFVGESGYADGAIRFSKEVDAEFAVGAFPRLLKVALGVITDKEEGSRIVREAMSHG